MRAWPVLLILVAGCLSPTAPEPPAWDVALYGDGTPVGGDDVAGARQEGQVVVQRTGNQWIATQRISVEGTTGTAARIDLSLDSFNGDLSVSTGQDYALVVDAFGRGSSEASAREALGKVAISFQHTWSGDVLHLGADATRDGRLSAGQSAGAAIDATVPAGPAYIVRADTSNGAIAVSGHMGPAALLGTSNGRIDYAGDTDLAWLSSSNGALFLAGGMVDVEADTSNGAIQAELRPTATGRHDFDSSNGAITVRYSSSDAAYDVFADTSNGDATVDIPDGDPIGRQDDDDAHVRSQGFDQADVRITVHVDSSNSDVSVRA